MKYNICLQKERFNEVQNIRPALSISKAREDADGFIFFEIDLITAFDVMQLFAAGVNCGTKSTLQFLNNEIPVANTYDSLLKGADTGEDERIIHH